MKSLISSLLMISYFIPVLLLAQNLQYKTLDVEVKIINLGNLQGGVSLYNQDHYFLGIEMPFDSNGIAYFDDIELLTDVPTSVTDIFIQKYNGYSISKATISDRTSLSSVYFFNSEYLPVRYKVYNLLGQRIDDGILENVTDPGIYRLDLPSFGAAGIRIIQFYNKYFYLVTKSMNLKRSSSNKILAYKVDISEKALGRLKKNDGSNEEFIVTSLRIGYGVPGVGGGGTVKELWIDGVWQDYIFHQFDWNDDKPR